MGVALQCPDCGFKHRLDAVSDREVFPCAQCGRELKVPAAYRADAGATNGSAPPSSARPARSTRAAAPARPKHKVGAAPMRLPVRILLWVVAFVLGALVVRYLAKLTGFAGGDTFFDLLVDGSIGTYARLLALVPVWALFSTLFATLFIDGPRAWARRRAGETPSRPGTAVPRLPKAASGTSAAPSTAAAAAGAAAGTARSARSIPRREPAPVSSRPATTSSPRLPDPPPVAPAVTRTTAVAAAGAAASSTPERDDVDPDFTAQAAAGQRPRRIPRRGDGS
jgi:hypothetical protein